MTYTYIEAFIGLIMLLIGAEYNFNVENKPTRIALAAATNMNNHYQIANGLHLLVTYMVKNSIETVGNAALQGGSEVGTKLKDGITELVTGAVTEANKATQATIETGGALASSATWNFAGKPALIMAGISVTGLAAYITVEKGLPLVIDMIAREFMRPKLIIESSKKTITEQCAALFTSSENKPFEMVFSPGLKEHLDGIIKATSTIQGKIKEGKTNVKYRNLMLFGPPGTGKTMFAKKLAKESGLEYAFMSGSSFAKFQDGEGIKELDELFAWAKRSKGLMLFIDEAETFLSKRENMDPQSKAYQLLNNFLNYTGERSSQFMIVFATNHKNALDSAMYRRIDDLIEMPLPSQQQRFETLKHYRNKILLDIAQNDDSFIESLEECLSFEIMQSIAERTKGLSYGDLEGIINTLKTDSDVLKPSQLSHELVNTVVERAIKKHHDFTNGVHLGLIEN